MPNQRKKEITKKKPGTPGSSSEKGAIQKSRQLTAKLINSRRTRKRSKANEKQIPGRRVTMPSLQELEEYYNDSESDEPSNYESTTLTAENIQFNNEVFPCSYKNNVETDFNTPSTSKLNQKECNTPKESQLTENKIVSPNTATKLASNLMDMLSQISNPEELLDHLPLPPVVPQKRQKIPYIVGCKDRPRVIKKPKANFCKSDNYGIDMNATQSDEDDGCPRGCRSKKVKLSKSIFNAKSEEIATRVKEADKVVEKDHNAANTNFMTIPQASQFKDTTVNSTISNISMKPVIIANCITVDEDAEDIVDVQVTVPKPLFRYDDCYIIEENCKKNRGNQSKINTDVNKEDVIVIIDDEKNEESASNVGNMLLKSEPESMATQVVDKVVTNVISVESTKETQPSCSHIGPINTIIREQNKIGKSNGIGQRIEDGEIVPVKSSSKINMEKKIDQSKSPLKDKIPNNGNCPICSIYLVRYITVNVCGHSFCAKCLTESIKSIGRRCPSCKKSFIKTLA